MTAITIKRQERLFCFNLSANSMLSVIDILNLRVGVLYMRLVKSWQTRVVFYRHAGDGRRAVRRARGARVVRAEVVFAAQLARGVIPVEAGQKHPPRVPSPHLHHVRVSSGRDRDCSFCVRDCSFWRCCRILFPHHAVLHDIACMLCVPHMSK
jgi:hypothetical protein